MGKGATYPPGNVVVFLCISSYSKRRIIYALFHNLPWASGSFAARPPSGLHPWTPLGDFRSPTHSLPIPGKNLAVAHGCTLHGLKGAWHRAVIFSHARQLFGSRRILRCHSVCQTALKCIHFNVKYFGYVPTKSHAEEHLSETILFPEAPCPDACPQWRSQILCQHAQEIHTGRTPDNATACPCYAENPQIRPCEQVLASSSVMLSQTSHGRLTRRILRN